MSTDWDQKADSLLVLINGKRSEKEEYIKAIKSLNSLNVMHYYRSGHYSLLFHAITAENWEAFQLLLEHGADPSLRNTEGNNILQLLAKRNRVDMAQIASKNLAKDQLKSFVDQGSNSGWTPLMAAAESGSKEFAVWLLDNGADPNRPMPTGWTAMHAAAKKDNVEFVKLLIERGGNPNIPALHRDFGSNLTVADVTHNVTIHNMVKSFNDMS